MGRRCKDGDALAAQFFQPREVLGAQPGIRLDSRPGTTFAYLGLNLEDPALADPRVRDGAAPRLNVLSPRFREGADKYAC